uniref:Integrin alpha FG-GAP repeat containing 2 n=1 Tax=Timema monikensis TaxID=170555 RepID=A0A7R9E6A3_9NEOP|nr:unnamed protein product [Timema monikensis]
MRAVCFVNRLEIDLSGNVFSNALAFGDVDNDGQNEFIVGETSGELVVFKGGNIWQQLSGLGMITALANALVVLSLTAEDGESEVRISVGDLTEVGYVSLTLAPKRKTALYKSLGNYGNTALWYVVPQVVLLGDIDGDGNLELVLGLTDRVVRSYRWIHDSPDDDGQVSGKLVGLNKWECANQIGTVTLNYSPDGTPCLLVSQPGGTFMKISCCSEIKDDTTDNVSTEDLGVTSVDYHPLLSSRMRNPNVSTEILGCIRPPGAAKEDRTTMRYAVATLDGTLMLVQGQDVLWSMQVDHQLFALTKIDVTGDGTEEIVACSWDGQTYILDQEKRSVRFQLEESVRSFCSGYYALDPSKEAAPCFIYTTFSNKVSLHL